MTDDTADAYLRTPRGRWMAARARNLVHRSGVLVAVGGVTFALTFGLLLWFTRAEREALQRVPAPADTLDLARQATSLRRLQARADSVLAEVMPVRRVALRAPQPGDSLAGTDSAATLTDSSAVVVTVAEDGDDAAAVVAPVPPPRATLPDSVRAAIASLTARLERAQNAPLATSWRALAADPSLQQEPRVRLLADSLAAAERTRNEYDAIGGVDPIYLELSSRVTAIGRALERIASARIAALAGSGGTAAVASRTGTAGADRIVHVQFDSARYATALARRDEAARVADSVGTLLDAQRTEARRRDAARTRAQRRVDALAPPLAMLTASSAAAIGVALLVVLLLEVRAPRLADELEVSSQARVPVLLSIRSTDAVTPAALTSAFSQLTFDLQPALATTRTLIVAGDDGVLATRTAARLAERLVYEGRSVRLVSVPVHASRDVRVTPRTRVGRATPTNARSVLVYPQRDEGMAWTGEFSREALPGDAITVRAGTLDDIRQALISGDDTAHVILVVRTGSTPTAWLERARAEIHRTRGMSALGVVVWAPEIEDTDPVTFALDTTPQHGRPPALSPAR